MATKILLLMILLHVIDDFHLQDILANMKQKEWWRKQEGYKSMYRNDYKMALLIHSMSWSIMILIPAMIFYNLPGLLLLTAFIINAVIHYHIDDLKANKHKINLMVDQTVHLLQIITTWIIVWQWT